MMGQHHIYIGVTVHLLEYNRELFTNMPPIIHYISANVIEYSHDLHSHINFQVLCLVSASKGTDENEEP